MTERRTVRPPRNARRWNLTEAQILLQMQEHPEDWYHFGDYDNIDAVKALYRSGKIEAPPEGAGIISSMVTSLTFRVKQERTE